MNNKNKGCNICSNQKWLIDEDGIIAGIVDGKLTASYDGDNFIYEEKEVRVNFCPNCGRDITGDYF